MAYKTGTVWTFKPRGSRFEISLQIQREHNYIYDGDDEDGETQAKLDSGEFVAFSSRVLVELDGEEIASDYLGGSVYARDEMSDFWEMPRGGYFPDMVREAVREAREVIRNMPSVPYIRENAA